jgi:hypothetical protein
MGGGGLAVSGFWCHAVGFVSCVYQVSGFGRREDVFMFNLVYKEVRFAKIILQESVLLFNIKCSIPVKFDGQGGNIAILIK